MKVINLIFKSNDCSVFFFVCFFLKKTAYILYIFNKVCSVAQSYSTVWGPMDYTHQAVLPLEFSRQEYWIGVPLPTPGDLANPAIKTHLLHLLLWQVDSLPLASPGKHIYILSTHTHTHTHTYMLAFIIIIIELYLNISSKHF